MNRTWEEKRGGVDTRAATVFFPHQKGGGGEKKVISKIFHDEVAERSYGALVLHGSLQMPGGQRSSERPGPLARQSSIPDVHRMP